MVLHLPMDEGTGSTAGDISGYGNDGTIYGTTWVTHDDGYALSFDGENDYVDCGNPTALQFGTGDGTIEFWAQRKDASSDYFLTKYAHLNGWLIGQAAATPQLRFYFGENTPLYINSPTDSWVQDTWTHHVITLDRSGNAIYYVDAVAGTPVSMAPASGYNQTGGDLNLGGCTKLSQYRNVLIDEVRIYDRALSAQEILQRLEGASAPDSEPVPAVPNIFIFAAVFSACILVYTVRKRALAS